MPAVFDISPDELPIFLSETDENLSILDEILVDMESGHPEEDRLQVAFRAAHTLKGMAGMVGYESMVRLTHVLETVLDNLRKGQVSLSAPLVSLCLDIVDGLRLLRGEIIDDKQAAVDVEELEFRFQMMLNRPTGQELVQADPEPGSCPLQPGGRMVMVRAEIDSHSISPPARAFQLMLALHELGQIQEMEPNQAAIEAMTPVKYFSATLLTDYPLADIRLRLEEVSEVLSVEVGEMSSPVVESVPEVAPQVAAQAKSNGRSQVGVAPLTGSTVRTSVERLDQLVNLVGELITDRNHLNQIHSQIENKYAGDVVVEQFSELVAHINRIIGQLQEEALQLRMMPVRSILHRFPRLVRDLSQKMGKEVHLVLKGEDTELDRSIIEELNDPLIHLIRNAVDHGIETPAERAAQGKTLQGQITITAGHEQGRFVLTVKDDGRGIDTDALRRKAVEKGIIGPEEALTLSDEKAVELMFMPGITTADKITDVSGRGVGMDIVQNNIQRINGTILVESSVGNSTCFRIILPLTLAIVSSLLVQVRDTTYAIPLVMISETLRLKPEDIQYVFDRPVTLSRGTVLPLIELREAFDQSKGDDGQKDIWVVVVWSGRQRVGLVVDELVGKEEMVVKSMGSLVGDITGISGAAILGNGQVALIIDVPDLLRFVDVS